MHVCLCLLSMFVHLYACMFVLVIAAGSHCRNNVWVAVAQAGAGHWRQSRCQAQARCHGVMFCRPLAASALKPQIRKRPLVPKSQYQKPERTTAGRQAARLNLARSKLILAAICLPLPPRKLNMSIWCHRTPQILTSCQTLSAASGNMWTVWRAVVDMPKSEVDELQGHGHSRHRPHPTLGWRMVSTSCQPSVANCWPLAAHGCCRPLAARGNLGGAR